MRCKKHLTDLSSVVGVCASCLRERLFTLVAAQAQAQVQALSTLEDHRKTESANPPPLVFPRSVSPYITNRKSDNAAWPPPLHHHHHHSFPDRRFFSTPQVGPTGGIVDEGGSSYRKKHGRFSFFSKLFRSKSHKLDFDPRVSNTREQCAAATSASASAVNSSPSWFSGIMPGRRKKQSRLFSLDESTAAARGPRICRNRDRGMSPVRYSAEEQDEECREGSSGYSSESSQGWKETPRRTAHPARRGARPLNHRRNVSGLAFCLSPLVRASPNRQWNQKGMPPDSSFSGEIRVQVKPHISNAASFCANRSRKLADFGRYNPNS